MRYKPFVRSPYNYDVDEASKESAYVDDSGEVLTQQGPSEDCDINTIVRRFGITGQLPVGAEMPSFQEFAEVGDYHTAQNVIRRADEAFQELPGEIRAQFENDPGRFVAFVEDPKNVDQVEKWGFLAPEASKRRQEARAASAAAQATPPATPPVKGAQGAS